MISVDIEMKLWQISVPVSIQNSNDFAPYFTYKMAHGLFKMSRVLSCMMSFSNTLFWIPQSTPALHVDSYKTENDVWTQISSKGNIEDFAKMLNRWQVT